jgi:acyl carrier protein
MNPRADSPAPPEGRDAATARLLEVVRELARELHPARQRLAVALDSRLAQDLGLDSLARMELAARLERVFGANLPESVFASAETVRDLLDAIQRAPAAATTAGAISSTRPVPESAGAGEVGPPPADTESLIEVLRGHARRHAARTHLTLHDDEARPAERISDAALLKSAPRPPCS